MRHYRISRDTSQPCTSNLRRNKLPSLCMRDSSQNILKCRQACIKDASFHPYFFSLVIDWIMKENNKKRQTECTAMDPMVPTGWSGFFWWSSPALTHSESEAWRKKKEGRKTDELNRISRSIGLRIHAGKSKVLMSERASEDPTITRKHTTWGSRIFYLFGKHNSVRRAEQKQLSMRE